MGAVDSCFGVNRERDCRRPRGDGYGSGAEGGGRSEGGGAEAEVDGGSGAEGRGRGEGGRSLESRLQVYSAQSV